MVNHGLRRDLTTPFLYYFFDLSWSWLANNIFLYMREETPSIKRSFVSLVMFVETLGIEELSPLALVHILLAALWKIGGIASIYYEAFFMCAIFLICCLFIFYCRRPL
jgi:hypothetical protein